MIALMRDLCADKRRFTGLRLLAWCLAAAVAAIAVPRAGAQDNAAVTTGGHGWNAVRTGPDRRPAVIHFPPRSGHNAVERGTVRFGAWLNDEPAWLAAWENDVYLAFPADPAAATDAPAAGSTASPSGDAPQHVVSMSALPLVAGLWENHQAGRFRTLPALKTGGGDVVGFVGSSVGPVALVRAGAPGDARAQLRLLVLSGNEWVELDHPLDHALAVGDRVHLVAMPDGPALVVEREEQPSGSFWTSNLREPRRGEVSVTWTEQSILFTGDAAGTFLGLDGQLIRHRHVDGRGRVLELIRPGPGGGVYEVAALSDVPWDADVVPLWGAGTLVMMWTVPEGEKAAQTYELREVSAFSGRVWYAGDGSSGGLVATRQFQILAVALVVIMATVLLFILRPGNQAAALPTGMTAAEPTRRLAAASADFLLGVLLASALTGTSGSEMLSPVVLLGSKSAAGSLLLAFWLTFAHTAAGEWLFGRSLGKAMAGCEVVRVERIALKALPAEGASSAEPIPALTITHLATSQRPLLWQALARNALRWGLPPLGLWVLAEPSSRHPGDLLARTVVVVRDPPAVQGPSENSPTDKGDRGNG
jgi:hypothetical protein